MRNKGTIALVVAVLLSVGYAIYDYQSEKSEEKKNNEISRVLRIDKDQISEFSIVNANGQSMTVERSAEGWKLTQPMAEVADQVAVQDYLDGVALETTKETVKSGGPIDWKIYALDKPAGTLKFKVNSGQEFNVDVSTKKNFSGDSYIRIQGEDKVYLAASTWLTKCEKRLIDFRDKRILRKAAVTIQDFRFQRGGTSVDVEKKENIWVALAQPSWKLDQSKSSEFVYMLNTVNAIEFAQEGGVMTLAQLKNFGLQNPKFSIQVSLKDTVKDKFVFGTNAKNEHFVQTFNPPRVLRISAQDMDKFEHITLESFRDRHEPFDFDKTHVKKIHVVNGSLTADFILKNGDWVLAQTNKDWDYQLDRPKALVALIRNLEVQDFHPTDSGVQKGQDLNQSVDFLDENDARIYQAQFFKTYIRSEQGMNKSFVLAKTSGFPTEIGVDEGTYRAIGIDTIVKIKKIEASSGKAGEK